MKCSSISQIITDRKDASLGIYFRDVSHLSRISSAEEVELSKRIQNGDKQAEDRLVTANLRFVISIAKQYQNKGLDLVDLIQEGNCGLIEASKRFDPDKGIKFITYAVWWIRQAIIKAISDQSRTIRVPIHQINCIGKISKATEKFEQQNDRSPSINELEDDTNISTDKISLSLSAITHTLSLENPVHDEDCGCLLDIIPNNVAPTDELVTKNDIPNVIREILEDLSYREYDMVCMYFGIGVNPMTNEEIGRKFGIGGERVRQVVRTAITKLRNNHKSELEELL